MSAQDQFDVVIPSTTDAGQALLERILSLLESSNSFPARDVFGIRLALDEAIVNAIKHGNQFDPDKTVRVNCLIHDGLFRVEIEDQGSGFRLEDVPDPTEDENLERPCGRGIMLMRSFMTHVEFNSLGNKVILEKRKQSP